jgi:hypothetical protein
MTVQKIKSGRINTVNADEYVASEGTIFYNEHLGDLRLGDGLTPGGIPIVTGSGSISNVTLDGGGPASVYGGINPIDGGGV